MTVPSATTNPITAIERAPPQPQPRLVFDDGHMVPGGLNDRSGDDKFTFSDLVALVNPLQHLPVIGPLYRKLTGDEPHPAVKAIGGFLFGGPLGLVNATLNHVFEQTTGKTMIEAAAQLFSGEATPVADGAAAVGAPRQLVPATAAAVPSTETGAARQARPTPPEAMATAPAAAPAAAFPAPPWKAARQSGPRDLAWYQANAGSRMPATVDGTTATGAQAPSVPRSAGPSHAQAPARTTGAAPPLAPSDFSNRLLDGLNRYRAFEQRALRGGAMLDRLE